MNMQLYNTMQSYGYIPPQNVQLDKFIRFAAPNKPKSNRSAWLIMKQGDRGQYAIFGSWATSEKHTWTENNQPLSYQEKAILQKEIEADLERRRNKELRKIQTSEKLVMNLIQYAEPAENNNNKHPYLVNKKVGAYGLYRMKYFKGVTEKYLYNIKDALLIPVESFNAETGAMYQSMQIIAPNGFKCFLAESITHGGHFFIRKPNDTYKIVICEGYATGATLAEIWPKYAVICAFNAGNLKKVAESIRANYPVHDIIIAGDNDHHLEKKGEINVGKVKAEEAARLVGGSVFIPEFKPEENGTDWNDYCRSRRPL